jgi:uncharacterized protein (TIGR03643 family)
MAPFKRLIQDPPLCVTVAIKFYKRKVRELKSKRKYTDEFISEIIDFAWADDISFEKIKRDRAVSEPEVIAIMRRHLKLRSFNLWRKRVSGRKSKHEKKSRFLKLV